MTLVAIFWAREERKALVWLFPTGHDRQWVDVTTQQRYQVMKVKEPSQNKKGRKKQKNQVNVCEEFERIEQILKKKIRKM
jgi:hypothetical protein